MNKRESNNAYGRQVAWIVNGAEMVWVDQSVNFHTGVLDAPRIGFAVSTLPLEQVKEFSAALTEVIALAEEWSKDTRKTK